MAKSPGDLPSDMIDRYVLLSKSGDPLLVLPCAETDNREGFLLYGVIVPKTIPAPLRDDLHSICVYYKAHEKGMKISFDEARDITRKMKSGKRKSIDG